MPDFTVKVDCKESDNFQAHQLYCRFRAAVLAESTDDSQVDSQFSAPAIVSCQLQPTPSKTRWIGLVNLPDSAVVGPIAISVKAPDGTLLYDQEHQIAPGQSELVISATARVYPPLVSSGSADAASRGRLRGRVIDSTGKQQIAGQQVAIIAVQDSGTEVILAAATTDSHGYFVADYFAGKLNSASIKVAAFDVQQIVLNHGRLPSRIIVSVDADSYGVGSSQGNQSNSEQDGDCACSVSVPSLPDAEDIINAPEVYTSDLTGGCVKLNKPNRTVEEFDFFGVVRTTEPDIVGLTLPEPQYIELGQILNLGQVSQRPGRTPGGPASPKGSTSPAGTTTLPKGEVPASGSQPAGTATQGAGSSQSPTGNHPRIPGRANFAHADNNPMPGSAGGATLANADNATVMDGRSKFVDPRLLKLYATGRGYTDEVLTEAANKTEEERITRALNQASNVEAARGKLTLSNPLDWDEQPTFYQAATVAHGHLLHFKQVWKASGFSLGDLLYSLPLAPGQKRQIAILDWERREVASRSESIEAEDALSANLNRDRDINEIVSASLKETVVGVSLAMTGSSASSSGTAGKGSGVQSALMTITGSAGGIGGAGSFGFQHGSRQASATSLQQIRDRISQAASSVRSQRSTVVQTVTQGEQLRAQTEVLANYNHCHALTIEYFEVLRHFAVEHRLVDVQECLFVPLLMSPFDKEKALRWRQSLQAALLDKQKYLPAFDALNRILHNYDGADLPANSYADEQIKDIDGVLRISFRLVRPEDVESESHIMLPNVEQWKGIASLTGINVGQFWKNNLQNAEDKDRVFIELLGKDIADELVSRLELYAVGQDEVRVPLQFELAADFQHRKPLLVKVRSRGRLPASLNRKSFRDIELRLRGLTSEKGLDRDLPAGTRMTLELLQLRYETDHIHHDLAFSGRDSQNLLEKDGLFVSTPISQAELRNPRHEDKERVNALLRHLHDNMEHYHRAIWLNMDSGRRFMLLDGITAPNAGGRSVASVVENRLIGIVGNSLVLPVVPGMKLDPVYQANSNDDVSLLDVYQPETDTPPLLVSVPTKGVYAEAVMGACNSCEKKDETRFWRWEESPLPDQASPIGLLSTDSRRAAPPDLTAKDFAQPIINVQNAPSAPDPAGLASMLQLIGNADSFKDLTGLNQNQLNAANALGAGMQLASDASQLALQKSMMSNIGQLEDQVKRSVQTGTLNEDDGKQIMKRAYEKAVGADVGRRNTGHENSTAADSVGNGNSSPHNPSSSSSGATAGDISNLPVANPIGGSSASGVIFSLDPSTDTRTYRSFGLAVVSTFGSSTFTAIVNPPANQSDFKFLWKAAPHPEAGIHSGTFSPALHNGFDITIRALRPGLSHLQCVLLDKLGNTVTSDVREISSPQYVYIKADMSEYKKFLALFDDCFDDEDSGKKITCKFDFEIAVADAIREVTNALLGDALLGAQPANLVFCCDKKADRFLCFAPNDLPEQHKTSDPVSDQLFMTVTLFNQTDSSLPVLARVRDESNLGTCEKFNHQIDVFPGNFFLQTTTKPPKGGGIAHLDKQTFTAMFALLQQKSVPQNADSALAKTMGTIVGRAIGETIAEEVLYCIVGKAFGTSSKPERYTDNPKDLMRYPYDKNLTDRTGIKIVPGLNLLTSPVEFPTASTISSNNLDDINKVIGGTAPVYGSRNVVPTILRLAE